MLKNYITTALRNLLKNRLYALINVLGLAIGLAIYVFGTVLVDYERSHDRNFANFDRIHTITTTFTPDANVGFVSADSVQMAFGPIMKTGMPEVGGIARIRREEFLLSIGEDAYYQDIRFTDPDFTRIFDFIYIAGDSTALDAPDSLILTRSTAERLFGDKDPMGQVIELDKETTATVTAVVEDLPANTHFNSSIIVDAPFEAMANLKVLEAARDVDLDQDWSDLSIGNMTYVLLPPNLDGEWLNARLEMLYDEHFPEDTKDLVSAVGAVPLARANTYLWEAVGLPLLTSVKILALLVLVVACVNYTNLAIAQSLGRAREVGLRRTMGAQRKQLLGQFLTESLVTATIAMIIALVMLETLIPAFNAVLGKVVALRYSEILPWLLATVLLVGVVSGGYPAYLIARTDPIDALKDGAGKGRTGGFLRSAMISVQFIIAVFMLASVTVMYFQNQKVKETINLFPSDQVIAIERMNRNEIQARAETLRSELRRLPGVVNVALTNQTPFDQSNRSVDVSLVAGDDSSSVTMNRIRIDHNFMDTLDIPILAGRNLSQDIASDGAGDGTTTPINVIVNELALSQLGFETMDAALGESFYSLGSDRQHTIIGVVPDQNYLGLHNNVKPMIFYADEDRYYAAVRIRPNNIENTLADIRRVWDDVYPDYPMQSKFLDEQFEGVYGIFRSINMALSGFAVVALALALIGLFGLAAFMAEQRTREIGIRRVLGASVPQLVRLLIWQFSKPVVWALVVALPLAYISAGLYLNVFADQINLIEAIVAGAGLVSIVLAWAIVATHASWVARANPIKALRYE